MKFVIAAAVAALSIGTVASAQVSEVRSSGPNTICAEKAPFGWKLTGDAGSVFRDWATNKAIGEAIGDGNCQDGWTMVSSVDQRVFESLGMGGVTSRGFDQTTVEGVTVVTNDAGRITATWQGFAPEVLKGRSVANGGDGTKWKLIDTDGVNHTYKLKRVGIHPWPKGSTWVATDQDIIDRDWKGGTAIVDPLRYDTLRYGASRDTTTTDKARVVGVTVRTVRFSCPSQWSYAHVSPTGEMFVYTQEAKPCQRRVSTKNINVERSSWSTVVVGDKYVTPQS